MASDFAKQKAWSRLRGTVKKSVLYVTVPGGMYRTIKSPGKVMLNSISVHPTDDCVLEVRDAFVEFPLFVTYLAAGNTWSLDPAQTDGTLSLILRNKTSMQMSAKLEIDWTIT